MQHRSFFQPTRKILFITIALIFAFWGMGCAISSNNPGISNAPTKMVTFVSQKYKYSIEYPDSWVAGETPNGNHGDDEVIAIVLPPGVSFPQLFIASKQFPKGTLDQVVSWGKMRASLRPKYSSISLSDLKTAKIKGVVNEYTWTDHTLIGDYIIHCQAWYVFDGETGFSLSFCSDDKDWAQNSIVFNRMIQSFDLQQE